MSSSDLQQLFAAAREDAPSDAVRDAVWGRVAAATCVPAAASAAAATKVGSTKLVALGAVIGAAGAASITALVMTASPADAPAPASGARRAPNAVAAAPVRARLADPAPRGRAEPAMPAEAPPAVATTTAGAAAAPSDASSLAEEARLVTEARLALVRGAPERALALVRAARKLPAHMLEPEELAIEARALRALGRTDEALATELTLKSRYPSHALAR